MRAEFAGAILDGGVRDLTEIRRDYGFPVYARAVFPGTTLGRFKTLGANVPVVCGGVEVNPGDIIVADIDGVVVVPRAHAEEILAMSQEIDRRELEQAKLIVQARSLKEGLTQVRPDLSMASAKRFDVVAIGEPMVEFNQTNTGEPRYFQGFGGDTSNMAIAVARQGARRPTSRGWATTSSAACCSTCGAARASTRRPWR